MTGNCQSSASGMLDNSCRQKSGWSCVDFRAVSTGYLPFTSGTKYN